MKKRQQLSSSKGLKSSCPFVRIEEHRPLCCCLVIYFAPVGLLAFRSLPGSGKHKRFRQGLPTRKEAACFIHPFFYGQKTNLCFCLLLNHHCPGVHTYRIPSLYMPIPSGSDDKLSDIWWGDADSGFRHQSDGFLWSWSHSGYFSSHVRGKLHYFLRICCCCCCCCLLI